MMPCKVACSYCGKRYYPERLKVHLRFFCGPHAAKSEALAKQQKKRKSGYEQKVDGQKQAGGQQEEDNGDGDDDDQEEQEGMCVCATYGLLMCLVFVLGHVCMGHMMTRVSVWMLHTPFGVCLHKVYQDVQS